MSRLRRFGHVQRRNNISRRMLRLGTPGWRPRGKPERRFMGLDVRVEDAVDH